MQTPVRMLTNMSAAGEKRKEELHHLTLELYALSHQERMVFISRTIANLRVGLI